MKMLMMTRFGRNGLADLLRRFCVLKRYAAVVLRSRKRGSMAEEPQYPNHVRVDLVRLQTLQFGSQSMYLQPYFPNGPAPLPGHACLVRTTRSKRSGSWNSRALFLVVLWSELGGEDVKPLLPKRQGKAFLANSDEGHETRTGGFL